MSKFKTIAPHSVHADVLDTARRWVYPVGRFSDVPDPLRRAYLLRGRGESDGFYKIKPELAKRIEFDRFNLIEPFSRHTLFHVIFCRNVMMYFDKPTQQDIVRRAPAWSAGVSLCGTFRVAHRRRTCFAIRPAGHLSQP